MPDYRHFVSSFLVTLGCGCSDSAPPENATFEAASMPAPAPTTPELTPYLNGIHDSACTVHINHDCGMESQIKITPPQGFEWPDQETTCTLKYVVQAGGSVSVRSVTCADYRFVDAVTQGASTIRYATTDVCGRPCGTIGRELEYPIIFTK